MNNVDLSSYWSERYQNNRISWDCSSITDPIKTYVDQIINKDLKILIPGCGNCYEGEYLWINGFKNTFIMDFAPECLNNFHLRVPDFPKDQLLRVDFFDFQGSFDLIIEQTMFCAINPNKRSEYAQKTASLLKPGGKLVGVLFNREFEGGPPFGGDIHEYQETFSPFFKEIHFNPCYNSIKPRLGTELFMKLIK